jgi:hypothetical protein
MKFHLPLKKEKKTGNGMHNGALDDLAEYRLKLLVAFVTLPLVELLIKNADKRDWRRNISLTHSIFQILFMSNCPKSKGHRSR